jgi:ADP-heptose:LPS heptosyltransferase
LPWAASFVERFPSYLDGFIEFPGFPGLPERPVAIGRWPTFLQDVQDRAFDLVIQMHGSGNLVNSMCELFGAKNLAGYYKPGEYCPDPSTFIEYPQYGLEIDRHIELAQSLGAPASGAGLEFPLTAVDFRELDDVSKSARLAEHNYVCLHPGARYLSRRWPAERFAAVGDTLADEGLRVVITGSPEETALAQNVASLMRAPALNLAGRTTLGALAALVSRAALVVTNDTGMSHLADALSAPSLILVLGSDSERWRPRDRRLHRIVSVSVDCRPCEHRVCPIDFDCALRLEPHAVVTVAKELLAISRANAEQVPTAKQEASERNLARVV